MSPKELMIDDLVQLQHSFKLYGIEKEFDI